MSDDLTALLDQLHARPEWRTIGRLLEDLRDSKVRQLVHSQGATHVEMASIAGEIRGLDTTLQRLTKKGQT